MVNTNTGYIRGCIKVMTSHLPQWENFIWYNRDKIIYGPVDSRRLKKSLGINLFPTNHGGKKCTFNCIYCDCGLTENNFCKRHFIDKVIPLKALKLEIERGFRYHLEKDTHIDYITFAGNGEPTLYPLFSEIVDYTISLRNRLFPGIPLAIFTNSTLVKNPRIAKTISRLEEKIFKLDAADKDTFELINQPLNGFSFYSIVDTLSQLKEIKLSSCVVLSKRFNNFNSLKSLDFIRIIEKIQPMEVHLYSIDYPSALGELKRTNLTKMLELAKFIVGHIDITVKVLQSKDAFPQNLLKENGRN